MKKDNVLLNNNKNKDAWEYSSNCNHCSIKIKLTRQQCREEGRNRNLKNGRNPNYFMWLCYECLILDKKDQKIRDKKDKLFKEKHPLIWKLKQIRIYRKITGYKKKYYGSATGFARGFGYKLLSYILMYFIGGALVGLIAVLIGKLH